MFQAESVIIKQTWVKELRELIQQFRFGILPPRSKISLTVIFFVDTKLIS